MHLSICASNSHAKRSASIILFYKKTYHARIKNKKKLRTLNSQEHTKDARENPIMVSFDKHHVYCIRD
jgi:uncharacterized protein YifE (UPF0438 family)